MSESYCNNALRDEQVVIRRVLAGSKDEFRMLIEAHQQRIFAMIYRQVGERSAALDLTQETFVRAYTNLAQFRFESAFSTWLSRIALNVTNTYFSSRGYRERSRSISLEHAKDIEQAPAPAAGGEDDSISHLRAVLSTLPPKHREVLVLCGFEQRSYQEAAELLRIPVGTVRSRLNKARTLLRKSYFEA